VRLLELVRQVPLVFQQRFQLWLLALDLQVQHQQVLHLEMRHEASWPPEGQWLMNRSLQTHQVLRVLLKLLLNQCLVLWQCHKRVVAPICFSCLGAKPQTG
jgi:hypothetical protein